MDINIDITSVDMDIIMDVNIDVITNITMDITTNIIMDITTNIDTIIVTIMFMSINIFTMDTMDITMENIIHTRHLDKRKDSSEDCSIFKIKYKCVNMMQFTTNKFCLLSS